MKFNRINQTWRIFRVPSHEGVALELLAYQCGYRVSDMCIALDCSQRHLYGVFMRDIGISPKEWLDLQRMVLARTLLTAGKAIRAVAVALGYSTVVAFTRRFDRVYGMPPGRFVKSLQMFTPAKFVRCNAEPQVSGLG